MEKLLYFCAKDLDGRSGVAKKVVGQLFVFSKFYEVYVMYFQRDDSAVCLKQINPCAKDGENILEMVDERRIAENGSRYSYFCEGIKIIECWHFPLIYMRFPYWDPCSIQMLKEMRKKGSIVLCEIPTYPYWKELQLQPLLKRAYWSVCDTYYRKQLKKYIERIVVLSQDERVYDIPCIHIMNGIDLRSCRVRTPQRTYVGKNADSVLQVVCVACFSPSHAIDRFLRGMVHYYQEGGTKNMVLHLVGDVMAVPQLRTIADNPLIFRRVVFENYLQGKQLDAIYDNADIAIAPLGLHRVECFPDSSLKTREYLAKGIPFIYATEIDVLKNKNVDFALKISSDESEVNIKDVFSFCDTLYSQQTVQEVTDKIRNFAEESVSMEKTMRPVLEFFSNRM